jgi:predicted Fe-Mo cluster-binding NifX family protein
MKVIMPVHKGYLGAHFGRAEQFIIYEIENGEVKDKKEIAAAYDVRHSHHEQISADHQCSHESGGHSVHEGHSGHHGAIAQFMKLNGADVLIACGIGPGAVNDIKSQGIKVISGIAPRRPDEIINDFINNKLEQDLAVKVCRH